MYPVDGTCKAGAVGTIAPEALADVLAISWFAAAAPPQTHRQERQDARTEQCVNCACRFHEVNQLARD